jgi:hypothetical protein
MKYNIDRHIAGSVADGPKYLFGILDIDVPANRQTHEVKHLLAMNQGDNSGTPSVFQLLYQLKTTGLNHILPQKGHQDKDSQDYPENIKKRELQCFTSRFWLSINIPWQSRFIQQNGIRNLFRCPILPAIKGPVRSP